MSDEILKEDEDKEKEEEVMIGTLKTPPVETEDHHDEFDVFLGESEDLEGDDAVAVVKNNHDVDDEDGDYPFNAEDLE
jgi:hypothetical protein